MCTPKYLSAPSHEPSTATIAEAAYPKRHQRLNEILIFTRTILEISKVVGKKTLSGTCAFCEQAYAV